MITLRLGFVLFIMLIGTPVMVSNNGTHWKLKKYNEVLQNKYIVPVDKFDFSNFEANKY